MEGSEGQAKPAQKIQTKTRSLPPSSSLPPTLSIPHSPLLPSSQEYSVSSRSSVRSTSTFDSSQSPLQPPSPGKPSQPETLTPSQTSPGSQPPEMPTILFPANEPNPEVGFVGAHIAKNEEDLIAALHLIADSVAQQRQMASSAILHHPLYWILLFAMAEYLWRFFYYSPHDWIIVFFFWAFGVMISLRLVKALGSKYLDEAERVGTWAWLFGPQWVSYFLNDMPTNVALYWVLWNHVWLLAPAGSPEIWEEGTRQFMNRYAPGSSSSLSESEHDSDGGSESTPIWDQYRRQQLQREITEDFEAHCIANGWHRDWIFVSKYRGEVIAALVMRVLPVGADTVPRDSNNTGVLRDRAVIRAWTVKQALRGHGLGRETLRYAIDTAKLLGWEGPVFADDHANSKRLWLSLFNEQMNRGDKRARALLAREVRARAAVEAREAQTV